MGEDTAESETINLVQEQQRLLERANGARARRAATTVYGSRDTVLRQTVIALLADSELAEHDSPPEATLHVLSGKIQLIVGDQPTEIAAGDLIEIPSERHSVVALEDSVFLLTAIRKV
ncbi:MAG: cupin domain-containing protein [Leucobacter sp.]